MAKLKPDTSPTSAQQKPALRLGRPIVIGDGGADRNFAEIKFKRLVEHMNEAVWVGDKNELTVYANPKFCEIMEYSLEEMIGRPSYDFWTKKSARRVRAVNEKDRRRGISSNYEGDLLTKSGEKIPVLLSGTPLPDGGTIGIMTDLREIRRKEAQTEESLLDRFDLAVQGSNDGLWYTEIPLLSALKGKDYLKYSDHNVWYSPRFKEILGFDRHSYADTLGAWLTRIHPEDFKRVMSQIRFILDTQGSFEIEYRMRCSSGEWRWVCTRGEARLGKSGKNLRVAGSFRDVTENRRTRETLAKRAREAHLLYQANAHMRMVHPLRQVISDLSKDLATACRETPNAYTVMQFDEKCFSKNTLSEPATQRIVETISVRGKERGVIELRYRKAVEPEATVFNDDRQTLMTLGTFIRKHVSSREIMERYQKLVKKSVMGIFIQQEGVFKFANPKFARLFRCKEAEIIGKKYNTFLLDSDTIGKEGKNRNQIGSRAIARGKRKDGSLMDLEIFTQSIDYHGSPALLGTVQDITRLKRADEKTRDFNQELRKKVAERTEDLKRANQRLQSLNELKDEFIAVTSHELRSPLTAARGYLSFIVEDKAAFGAIPESLKDYFVRVHDNVEVLNNLVTNILDVSRIETGRFELYKKPTDIVELIQTVILNFGYQLGEKRLNITFSNRLAPKALTLNIDPIRMRQVFRNLLDNAVKYTPAGKRIRLEIEVRGIGVQISISDEGIGIPKSQIFEVFDKFKQAKNSQSAYKGGAGLGLFIVKKIMELHGGMIWAESQLKKGTTFRLQLPLN